MIYFIQDSGTLFIKIGFTDSDPMDRLKALQTGCPSQLVLLWSCDGDISAEGSLHCRFADARDRGEWFRPVPELLRFIIAESSKPKKPLPVYVPPPPERETGAGVPVEDFISEGYCEEFNDEEQPNAWSLTHQLGCPMCGYSIVDIVGTEKPSPDCPGADNSVSILFSCKEGCLVRFNFVERDHRVYFWSSFPPEEDANAIEPGIETWAEAIDA